MEGEARLPQGDQYITPSVVDDDHQRQHEEYDDDDDDADLPKWAERSDSSVHDIFLSHSGKEKGFAKDLYDALRIKGFPTLLDNEHHSLPIAENSRARISKAACTCKLGVVVLSNAYLFSKWPMLELLALVEAMRPPSCVKILPLFFRLSVSDLTEERNLSKWRKAWVSSGLDVAECLNALDVLRSNNMGLEHDAASEGEATFTHSIVQSILELVTDLQYSRMDQGEARLQEIILKKIEEMASPRRHNLIISKAETKLSAQEEIDVAETSRSASSAAADQLGPHPTPDSNVC